MRVLITGASGFVGANVTRGFLTNEHEVHVFHRPGSDLWRLANCMEKLQAYAVDLRDAATVLSTVRKVKPELVIHLAAYGAYSFQQAVDQILTTNILGTASLINACLDLPIYRFIHTGTSSEYGFKRNASAETDWLEPNSFYAVSKASATLYAQYVARARGFPITTLRLFSVYGPYEDGRRFVPTLLRAAMAGHLPPLTAPNTARDFVYVEDVVEAYVRVATVAHPPGEIFNVGGGMQTTLLEAVEIARQITGITAEAHFGTMEDRIWDTTVWVANVVKIGEQIGWRARTSLHEGFVRTLAWLREHPDVGHPACPAQ